MAAAVSFGALPAPPRAIDPPGPDSPFRIGVLSDFTGRNNRGIIGNSQEIAARRPLRITRDSLDDVMAKLAPQLVLPVFADGSTITLSFAALDHFHPDSILERVPQFDSYDNDDKSALLGAILHHSDFQVLESAWRGLALLLARSAKGSSASGSTVEVVVLDLSFTELAYDLQSSADLSATGIYQSLIGRLERGPRAEPWGALVADYCFDFGADYVMLLGRLAKIVSHANAPLLTTVHPRIFDSSYAMPADVASAWQSLRQLREAALVHLATPRFLLRLPYGENTQSIERLAYEELATPPERSHYCWGNPAYLSAALLAMEFQKLAWTIRPGGLLKIENLPIHVLHIDGEEEVTLAEAWLVRPQTEQLARLGIMPYLGVRGKGELQLLRFGSLAEVGKDQPPAELAGHWSAPIAGAVAPAVVARTGPKVSLVADSPPEPGGVPAKAAPAPPARAPVAPAATAAPAAAPKPPAAAAAPPPAAKPAAPPAAPAAPPPAAAPPPEPLPAEEEEMDPDLAALLKQLEG